MIYSAVKGWLSENSKRVWKEVVVVYPQLLDRRPPGGLRKNLEKLQHTASQFLIFQNENTEYEAKVLNHRHATFCRWYFRYKY